MATDNFSIAGFAWRVAFALLILWIFLWRSMTQAIGLLGLLLMAAFTVALVLGDRPSATDRASLRGRHRRPGLRVVAGVESNDRPASLLKGGKPMQPLRRLLGPITAALLLAPAATATAQDANITQPVADLEQLLAAEPMVIAQAEISRPKAKGDITLRAIVSFGEAAPLRVKLRKAEPGAEAFNNVPRYDLAAYELQKLFLDPHEYVVPPTALRMVPLADFARYSPGVERTFSAADQVLAVVQYWLNDIKVVADVYSPERFAADPVYARHIGQLNVLTYLIRHRDSNLGNFLLGNAETGARVFSIDHGVAFRSDEGDRGEIWKNMRVNQLPADIVERLRQITPQLLTDRLAVLAQWRLDGRGYVRVASGENLRENRGVRRTDNDLQMGLTQSEIRDVYRQLTRLLERIDRGEVTLLPAAVATTTSP